MGKAVLVKALANAFAFCESAFSALSDQSVTQMVKQGGVRLRAAQ
jgi:hypothetical protein